MQMKFLAVAILTSAAALAQTKAVEKNVLIMAPPGSAAGPETMRFLSAEFSSGGRLVKGAPYSAEAVNEMVQILADGNRLSRKSSTTMYRDSEGRSRTDQNIGSVGPWAANGEPATAIFIDDPVAGVRYMLDSKAKTALEVPLFTPNAKQRAEMSEGNRMVRQMVLRHGEEGATASAAVPHVMQFRTETDVATGDAKRQDLGKQSVEGVLCEGTRETMTIPAGQIGNDLPLETVTERWYSPELQLVVMSKTKDPRFGETTYRLTNLRRTDPAPAIFQVPADYKLSDQPGMMMRMPSPGGK